MYSIQNSMGKFILNNINEFIPKCQGLNVIAKNWNNKLSAIKDIIIDPKNKNFFNFILYIFFR